MSAALNAFADLADAAPSSASSERLHVRADGFARTYSEPVGRIGKLIFERTPEGWFVADDGVQGGVFIHGCRTERLPLQPGRAVDVRIGSATGHKVTFEVSAPPVKPKAKTKGQPQFVVDSVDVATADGRTLVRRASFALDAGELVAVIGPSGAGKSTLLRAMTGQQLPASGRVTWRGIDLNADDDVRRSHVGLVPQEEILHPQLTVRHSLEFAARLRLPSGTSADQRHSTVERVIKQLGLGQRAEIPVRNLSGGQRKRVSIATELLTAPPLLFLDEPTSGLDPGLDRSVMEQLRALADERRLVVVATHSVMGLDVCDKVVAVGRGGIVAYVGAPAGILEFFGVDDYPALFDRLATGNLEPVGLDRGPRVRVGGLPILGRTSAVAQLSTLMLRNLAVMLADRLNVAMLLVLPLVLAILARVVQGSNGLALLPTRTPKGLLDGSEAGQRLAILVIAASLLGVAMSVRELVKERAIWQREYAVGVGPGIYFVSKLLVLLPITFTQGAVVAWLAMVGLPGPDGNGLFNAGRVEIEVAVGLLAAVMAAAGLLVSALVRSVDQVMPALVAIVMSQVVLSSALIHLAGRPILDQISWLAPARWGFAATAATTNLERGKDGLPGAVHDGLAAATTGQWILDLSMLGLLGAGLVVAGARAVRRSV